MIGTPGFIGERLAQARVARGLTSIALAEVLGLSSSSNITLYESGRQTPSSDVLDRIVDTLNMPRDFFLHEITEFDMSGINYRSMSTATKTARSRAEIRYRWLREITDYVRKYVDFPPLNIPALIVPEDPSLISAEMIEEMATQCRAFYKLGDGPVPDLVTLLERNGVVISRGELGAETLDAFSQTPRDDDRAFIFLGSDKESAVRSRFDCAHELGHILMHRNVATSTRRSTKAHSLMEQQCHLFASCFLLPESGFTRELFAPTLDGFLALKPRWRVAIAAMIKKTEDLGIITETQARRLWINMSRRGWRKQEPLDNKLVSEQPRMLRRSFELLFESGVKTPKQVVDDLRLPASEIERLACLPDGTLTRQDVVEPRLKSANEKGVIPFRPRAV